MLKSSHAPKCLMEEPLWHFPLINRYTVQVRCSGEWKENGTPQNAKRAFLLQKRYIDLYIQNGR